jgi:hypothetical protein
MYRLIDIATGEVCGQSGNAAGYSAQLGVLCPGARCEMPRLQLLSVAESLATNRAVEPVAAPHLQGSGQWEDAEVPPLGVTTSDKHEF